MIVCLLIILFLIGISFLPRHPNSSHTAAYDQMPYEAITKEQYDTYVITQIAKRSTSESLSSLCCVNATNIQPEIAELPDRFCDSAACAVNTP